MNISHPRRILVLCPSETDLSPLLEALISPLSNENGSKTSRTSGNANTLPIGEASAENTNYDSPIHHIQTPYYSAHVPIWTDHIESSETWSADWKAQDGAGEVVRAIGAWIVAFTKPSHSREENSVKTLLKQVADVISHHASNDYDYDASDAALLAVALPSRIASEYTFDDQSWDDHCQENGGWEFINGEADGRRNQFGESTGFTRLLQALQAAEWDAGEENLDDMLGLNENDSGIASEDEGGSEALGEEATAEMREPILGSASIETTTAKKSGKKEENPQEDDGSNDLNDNDVEELQRMMTRLQAARDMGADLPIAERRKLAAKAVREVMRGS